ncbi:MAG TPA: hypothetical protein VN957_20325 [Chthoniobacterales bacterium]|nr:hypothetical protein [Chthoniobacterales bacterium]
MRLMILGNTRVSGKQSYAAKNIMTPNLIWALTTRLPNQNTSPTGTPRTEETLLIGFDAISAVSS